MRFPKTKILVPFLVLISLGIAGNGVWLHNPPAPPQVEPNFPQISLTKDIPPLAPAIPQPAQQASKETIVQFDNEPQKRNFLEANSLSAADLKPVDELHDTFTVARQENTLKTAGALVSQQKQYTALLAPNDPIYPQWYTDKISAPSAWDTYTGSSGVTVAVIDSGFALNHEDLSDRWASGGKDFVNNDNDPSTGTTNPSGAGVSHGTVTAGLVGAASNNAKGVAAIDWGARILPLQALDDNGSGTTSDVAAAVRYAVDQGAKIINMSLGSAMPDPILKAELDYAQSHDVLVVAAAGNCGSPSSYFLNGCSAPGQMVYPANYPQVLAVGATDSNDVRASFSSYGSNLDVMAPGSGSIRSTAWSSSNQTSAYTTNINGTSFSSPIVAGLAALYNGYKPAASATATANAIIDNADKISAMSGQNFASEYGFGRINAVRTLVGTPAAPVTTQPAPVPTETNNTPLPTLVQDSAHPNGTLISLNGRVYLVDGGTKRWITNGDVFNSHGYAWFQVKASSSGDADLISGTDINTLAPGTIFRTDNSPVYVMTYQSGSLLKQQISQSAFVSLGYNWGDVVYVPPGNVPTQTATDILFADQHPVGTLVAGNGKVYLLDQTSKRWILSPDAFITNNYDWGKIKSATAQDLSLADGTPLDLRLGNMLIFGGNIYLVDYDSTGILKRPVGPWECFADRWHYAPRDLYQVSPSALPARDGSLATC